MTGYTSSTKDQKVARSFALFKATDIKLPVVYKIDFKGSKGLFGMTADYSAYPEEEEVLIHKDPNSFLRLGYEYDYKKESIFWYYLCSKYSKIIDDVKRCNQ